jgi:alkylation response protein AidB-like acyl-CoA dehydrogenase
MDTGFDTEVEALRAEVRTYLAEVMRPDAVAGHADPRDLTGLDEAFERALHVDAGARSYLALTLPVEWGGGGRSPAYRAAFGLEAAAHDAPLVDTALTLGGAPILAHGSPEQRRTLLPAMARGEILLCIAYTEPGAGSDLAAVATTAWRADPDDPDGDWILSGTKHLVTGAHKSDWCLVIARTDPDPGVPARKAMSMFVFDLRTTPGVEVRRDRTANDWTLGTIVLSEARVPASALLGEEGRGFAQMAAALADERSGFFWVGWAEQRLADLVDHVRTVGVDHLAVPAAIARDTLARLWIDVALARRLAAAVVDVQARAGDATVSAAMSKVFVTELLQRIASAGIALLGPAGLLTAPLFGPAPSDAPLRGRFAWECVERLHPTISVGSNEIQRDLLAHRALGLPIG